MEPRLFANPFQLKTGVTPEPDKQRFSCNVRRKVTQPDSDGSRLSRPHRLLHSVVQLLSVEHQHVHRLLVVEYPSNEANFCYVMWTRVKTCKNLILLAVHVLAHHCRLHCWQNSQLSSQGRNFLTHLKVARHVCASCVACGCWSKPEADWCGSSCPCSAWPTPWPAPWSSRWRQPTPWRTLSAPALCLSHRGSARWDTEVR